MTGPDVLTRLAAIAMAFALTFAVTNASTMLPASPAPALIGIPMQLADWSGVEAPPLAPDVANVLAADTYVHRYYSSAQGVVEADVAYYAQPRVGSNMHSPLNCLPGNGWQVSEIGTAVVPSTAGAQTVRHVVVDRGAARFAMLYWFQGRQRVTVDEIKTRVYRLTDTLTRKPTDAAVVRVLMPAQGSAQDEQAILTTFASHLLPELSARFR